jgi:hypothetical protein
MNRPKSITSFIIKMIIKKKVFNILFLVTLCPSWPLTSHYHGAPFPPLHPPRPSPRIIATWIILPHAMPFQNCFRIKWTKKTQFVSGINKTGNNSTVADIQHLRSPWVGMGRYQAIHIMLAV